MNLRLGTVQFGLDYGINNQKKPSIADAVTMLDYAAQNGITRFDTAFAYGTAESVVGESEYCILPVSEIIPSNNNSALSLACIATSFEIPKSEHARGIRSREPPATPEAPQAPSVASTHKMIAVGRSTEIPSVFAAAKVITEIVIAAPSILIVAPRGIETEYMSSSSPSFSQSSMFTGILAAELLVKKAVIPLSRRHRRTRG